MQTYKVTVNNYRDTFWYKTGTKELHRVDGPAVERTNGSKEWCLDGKLHRVDGPAVECADGDKEWWLDGKRHRTDGPAVEWAYGGEEWWLDGKQLTEQEWQKQINSCQGKVVEIDGKKYRLEEV